MLLLMIIVMIMVNSVVNLANVHLKVKNINKSI
jgi:hypothetical protein